MPASRCRFKMDANYDTIMLELNNEVIFDTDETKEEQESFLVPEKDSDDIPPSLLSYFETSKSRAAVCEKLILEEIEDFTASHHTDGTMNLPFQLDKDMRKPNEQVTCDTENEENNTSTDARLLPAPTEPLFTHNVSVCPNDEVADGTDEYMESEKHFAFEYEAEQEKRHCEKKEEERRQIERDFQKELKKIMEAEKLHQKEFELMGKRAQQKLEQELLLQQEVISNLQRRVEEERKMREEEQKRIKDEEDKRKREEEKIKIEAERKRMEEETRRKKEEERKIEEITLKREEERKRKEEEKRRMEREEKRKREERIEIDLEKKKLEDGLRMTKEKEERKREEEKRKKEKERKETEEARKKMEKEKRKLEEEMSLKEEEEESKKSNKENMRIQEEVRRTKEIEERKKQDERRTNKEEQEADDRKKMAQEKLNEEMRRRGKSKHENEDEEIQFVERQKKEEKDGEKTEEKREVKEKVREKEGENRKLKEELGPIEEDEERKTYYEKKTKEEERKRKQRDEVCSRIRLKEDQEGCKGSDVYNRKLEHESKAKEKKQEETSKREEEIKNVEGEKQVKGECMGETKKEVPEQTEEEIRLKVKEGSQKRVVHDREKDERANELQEKRENNSTNKDETENSLVSQLQDSTTWTSSSPGPSHSESTVRPTSTETVPQQHDPEENISQTSIDKTVDWENQAARPSPVFLPVCLPVHTENKRLSWMKDCIPWSKLSLQNKRKQKGSVRSRRGLRGAAEAGSLPPLCPDTLLQFTGRKSLREMTTVTLEDLPGCSLTTLAQCTQLQSLTLRRCGLKSLEGINQIPQLCYVDVQENDISFVNCENMTSLRVLQLGHNKLTSIHGLSGAENLDVLDLSHNSITRIAGLESMRRLQRLSLDHNQLISTKGLRDVFTLLHLNCSHNHLASVEGLENSALLNTLDLRANSLTEPPSLNNQVLLRELHLDDNSISSLQGLTACWLPLMQHLSVAQNRITQLPSMSDSVSLANLDLRFNCMSELQNVCESLEGCPSLREVHLTGNPLQQESGWRSTLQKAVPGLRAIDDQETDSFLPPRAVQQVSLAPGSFLAFCQAQLQQTGDLQQQHSRELSNASSSLDAVKTSCRHFAEALQLAKDQRFAHEYGNTTVAAKHRAASQTKPEERLGHMDSTNAEKCTECPEMESTGKVQPVLPNRDNIRYKYWTFEEKLAAESLHYSFDTVARGPKTEPTICRANSGSVHSSATNGKPTSSNNEMAPVSNHQDLDLQNTAAVVIQQLWRKYRLKCENISSLSTAEKGGGSGRDGGKPESGPSYINGSIVGQDYAATVIQAFWRGFTLRRRLASALAAVTCPDTGEDDTFEEVDMDECVFDEAALEIDWTLSLTEDPPPRRYPVSEQPLFLKPPGHFPEPSQYILPPPLVLRPKQAWVPGEQVDSAGQRLSPESPIRGKSPASTSTLSGLSERSEKILEEWGFTDRHTALLMLKRAQKMKSTKQQQKKRRDPSVRLALFRNCSPQLGPVEARNMPAQHNRNYLRVGVAELGLQQAEMVERVTQERAEQWLRTQAAHSDRDSESEHFLPEISSDILNGGRVQLVADPGYTERLHQASGLWANSSLAAQPCKENNYPRRNSLGRARKEVPSPQRVTSAPSKKERISYRDNPVQLSGGWGGGKKRDKVYK